MSEQKVIGLIAGSGRLPFLVADGIKRSGMKVVCAGLAHSVESGLIDHVDTFKEVPLARIGAWIRFLRKHSVTETIMVGRVQKAQLYTPGRIMKYIPDWRAFRIYYWRLRKSNRHDDNLLGAISDELASGGIILTDSKKYCTEQLANKGLMTNTNPPASIQEDIEHGWELVKTLGKLDIGQALAIHERAVIAVESMEGTAEMIERAGRQCRRGGWVLLKAEKPDQDARFDVPCVGMETIKSLAKNKAKCLVIEAGKTFMLDKKEMIELADKLGIAIIGH